MAHVRPRHVPHMPHELSTSWRTCRVRRMARVKDLSGARAPGARGTREGPPERSCAWRTWDTWGEELARPREPGARGTRQGGNPPPPPHDLPGELAHLAHLDVSRRGRVVTTSTCATCARHTSALELPTCPTCARLASAREPDHMSAREPGARGTRGSSRALVSARVPGARGTRGG